jgi:radical SAM protein with 4Fe4S-binding SPASM domain
MRPIALRAIRRFPRVVIWEITTACNFRCLHCELSAGARRGDELSTDEALSVCDALADLGCEQCNVSGGEPLLRKDWPQICQRLATRGIRVSLISNGSLIDADLVSRAADHGVTGFALSLDGLRATHDRVRVWHGGDSAFDAVVAAARHVKQAKLALAVITHISRWNLDQLPALHSLLRELDTDMWQVQLGLPLGRLREIETPYIIQPTQLPDVAQLLTQLIQSGPRPLIRVTDTIGYYTACEPVLRGGNGVWTGCYAGILTLGIESNGDVKGCSCLPREFTAGNLRQRPLAEIWADESRFAYNTDWQESSLTGACATCPYRRVCRAGCTCLAYSVTGSIYENPYCLHRVLNMRPSA